MPFLFKKTKSENPKAGRSGLPCSYAGCKSDGVAACTYQNTLGVLCNTVWCEIHLESIAGVPYCQRHAELLESNSEVPNRPPLERDASLTTLLEVTNVMARELADLAPGLSDPEIFMEDNSQHQAFGRSSQVYLWVRNFLKDGRAELSVAIPSGDSRSMKVYASDRLIYEGAVDQRPSARELWV